MNNIKKKLSKGWVAAGLSLALVFTGSIGMGAASAHAATATSAQVKADRIISMGNHYLGTPYLYGARSGRTDRFDCSSFVQYLFKKQGISLPRTSAQQSKVGKYVPKSQLKKGDLVFFSTRHSHGRVAHVAIYAGNGKILHTYGAPGVTYSSLNSKWWSSHYITARRVLN